MHELTMSTPRIVTRILLLGKNTRAYVVAAREVVNAICTGEASGTELRNLRERQVNCELENIHRVLCRTSEE